MALIPLLDIIDELRQTLINLFPKKTLNMPLYLHLSTFLSDAEKRQALFQYTLVTSQKANCKSFRFISGVCLKKCTC